jgi:hypothetical protein
MSNSWTNDGWVPPSVWGPDLWSTLYHTAAGYDPSRHEVYQAYYDLIPPTLRCDECSLNAQQIWERRPVSAYLDSREKLLEWVWLQHMEVRKHQRVKSVPDFSLADVFRRYLPPTEVANAGQPPVTAPAIPVITAQAPISIFASSRPHPHTSYNGGGPVPATAFVPVATPTDLPSSTPISLFAGNFALQPLATAKVVAQSADGHVREQTRMAAIGYRGVNAPAVGLGRCCKNRIQASAATTQAFTV